MIVDFKGVEYELAAFGIQSGVGDSEGDFSYEVKTTTVSTQDASGIWTEHGTWKHDWEKCRTTLKYLIDDLTVSATKVKFVWHNNHGSYVGSQVERVRFYVVQNK